MEKVKITRQQSKAIEYVITKHSLPSITRIHVENGKQWCNECSDLNGMDLDALIRALYIGYEVEETPEEKVRDLYDSLLKAGHECEAETVVSTIQKLGLKIEGVNA